MIRLCRALAFLAGLLLAIVPGHARDRLVVALALEPPTLDPTSGAAAAIDEVTYHVIFEGLTTLDAAGSVHPLLAERWEVSADGLFYRFRLRDGIRFSDGEPCDAAAVAWSLKRAAAPGSTNAQRQAFANIDAIAVSGPRDLMIRLKTPDADFLRLLSYGDAAIVPPRAASRLATDPIGTGPFVFAGWSRGEVVRLVRNPHYWGRAAKLAELRFRFIGDPTASYAAIRARDVDLILNYMAPETLPALAADPGLKVVTGPTEGEVILALNQRSGPLADPRVRRALQQGIDRRAIIDGAMYGHGTPIGSHFPPQNPDYVDLTGFAPHDPAAARRLLAAAGYPRGFPLTITLPPPAYARRGGEIIAAELAQVGVAVTLRNVEWAEWLDEVLKRHAFQATVIAHAEPFDYDIYGRPDYYFGYRSAAFDALLAALKRTRDPAERHRLLGAVQRRLAADAANVFLFQYPLLSVGDARLRNLWVNTPNQAADYAAATFGDPGGAESIGRGGAGLPIRPLVLAAAVLLLLLVCRRLGPRFVARRLAVLLGTVLAATLLVFAALQVAPGDPAAFMMGLDANPAATAALRYELGLDGPAPARYLQWLAGLLHGDLGTSYTYRVPVAGLVRERLAVSLPLAVMATMLSVIVGVPAGVAAASLRSRGGRLGFDAAARIGIALPSFWLAILLILLFAVRLRWFPAGGFPGWGGGIGQGLAALALPAIALGLPQAAILARVTRGALAEALAADHVRTARATGASAGRALWRHALPLALGPVLTILGLQLPFLIAGSAIVESVFALPGLGRLVLQAIAQRDLIVVQSAVLLMVAATVLASFVVDLLQAVIDPRLRDGVRR